jgi:hypothetical protein
VLLQVVVEVVEVVGEGAGEGEEQGEGEEREGGRERERKWERDISEFPR